MTAIITLPSKCTGSGGGGGGEGQGGSNKGGDNPLSAFWRGYNELLDKQPLLTKVRCIIMHITY
jgi:hypothetical protein